MTQPLPVYSLPRASAMVHPVTIGYAVDRREAFDLLRDTYHDVGRVVEGPDVDSRLAYYPEFAKPQSEPAFPDVLPSAEPDMRLCIMADVFFGRNIGASLGVSDDAWSAFVDSEITPRFPDGLTVLDALGQWRDSENGTIVRERSKVLRVILSAPDSRAKLTAIAAAYKEQFHQQAVMLTITQAYVSL